MAVLRHLAPQSSRVPTSLLVALALAAPALVLGAFALGAGPLPSDAALTSLAVKPGGSYSSVAWFFNDFVRYEAIPILWGTTIIGLAAKRRGTLALLFVLLIAVGPLNMLLKDLYDRPRPLDGLGILGYPESASFPSGHTMTAAGFFGLWFVVAPQLFGTKAGRTIQIAAVLAIVLAGYSRVWALAHWPTDVAAGAGFGLAIVAALWAARPLVAECLVRAAAAIEALAWYLATGLLHQHGIDHPAPIVVFSRHL